MINNNIQNEKYQVLEDKKGDKVNDWQGKKMRNQVLLASAKRLNFSPHKIERIKDCGKYLEFKTFEDNTKKLHRAYFCKVRLCPMCAWRRSLKVFGQTATIMNEIAKTKQYRFIFLTLTCKNVYADKLDEQLNIMFKAFKRLVERKAFKKAVKGHFRALEITRNDDKNSPSYDTYHPHFHCVLAVNNSYFTDPEHYITHNKWVELWQKSLQVDYTPQVNIQAIKRTTRGEISEIVAEVSKYTVKDESYTITDENGNIDTIKTDEIVKLLDNVLSHRRLVAYGGIFKELHKKLNLDDINTDNIDLINTDTGEILNNELNYIIEVYKWCVGFKNYIKI